MSERRLIIGPCRSGTTMLLRSMKNHPDAVVEFQTIKAGQRKTGVPDYGFYDRPVPAGKFLVNKETIGYGTDADCSLAVFPHAEAIRAVRPLFIFREPGAAFASWLEQNLVPERDTRLFIQAYQHTFDLLLRAQAASRDAAVVTYEELCRDPRGLLEAVCEQWGIAFHPDMIDWKDAFIDTTPLDTDGVAAGHYAEAARDTAIHSPKEKKALREEDSRQIMHALETVYAHVRSLSL